MRSFSSSVLRLARAGAASLPLALAGGSGLAQQSLRPAYLPPYYEPLFAEPASPLELLGHNVQEKLDGYYYRSADGALMQAVERIGCSRQDCPVLLNGIVQGIDQQEAQEVSFDALGGEDVFATIFKEQSVSYAHIYRLPNALLIFSYAVPADAHLRRTRQKSDFAALFERTRAFADRQRYEEALAAGNVEMGSWGDSIRAHAFRLLSDGAKHEAVAVLQELVKTSPLDFEAHLALMENTDDPETARASAEALVGNVEGREPYVKAARRIGRTPVELDAVPPLEKGLAGLHLVLIPLGEVDLDLLGAAGELYREATGIPVSLRRLPAPWAPGRPDRPFLVFNGDIVNFGGRSAEAFVEQLRASLPDTALNRFAAADFERLLGKSDGQFDANRLLPLFLEKIRSHVSADRRVMYVGVTAQNIFADEARYLFNLYTEVDGVRGSLFSYRMLTAEIFDAAQQSRSRLAERIAKELVPASFHSLGIPRATDPRDPYSYSSGVDRVDQKTLKLSRPVAEALDKLR